MCCSIESQIKKENKKKGTRRSLRANTSHFACEFHLSRAERTVSTRGHVCFFLLCKKKKPSPPPHTRTVKNYIPSPSLGARTCGFIRVRRFAVVYSSFFASEAPKCRILLTRLVSNDASKSSCAFGYGQGYNALATLPLATPCKLKFPNRWNGTKYRISFGQEARRYRVTARDDTKIGRYIGRHGIVLRYERSDVFVWRCQNRMRYNKRDPGNPGPSVPK